MRQPNLPDTWQDTLVHYTKNILICLFIGGLLLSYEKSYAYYNYKTIEICVLIIKGALSRYYLILVIITLMAWYKNKTTSMQIQILIPYITSIYVLYLILMEIILNISILVLIGYLIML